MKEKIYEAFIIGATVSACAIASRFKNASVVIEDDMIAGDDFGSVYNIKYECTAVQGGEPLLVTRIKEKLPEGLPERAVMLSDLIVADIAGAGAKLLLCTRACDICFERGLYRIRVFGTYGFSDFFAKRVFDTTSVGAANALRGKESVKKSLCALLYRKSDGIFKRIMTHDTADYAVARASLLEQMKHEMPNGFELAAVSPVFMYLFDREISVKRGERYIVSPSASYRSIEAAYKGGITCASDI